MKRVEIFLMITLLLTGIVFQSCEKKETTNPQEQESIVPTTFTVEIPESLTSSAAYKSSDGDTLDGNQIYNHLRTFIFVGKHAGDIVEEVMLAISVYHLYQPMTFSFTSDEDGRLKLLEVVENVTYEGIAYQYMLSIIDNEPEGNETQNKALQVFWNNNPVTGVALINPYNINRNTDPKFELTMYRIDYSEAGNLGYTHHMIVSIDNFPLENPLIWPFSLSTMKMFVGKNGDLVSVYGNSEHPNARFINSDTGFDWAFVAAGYRSENIAVAEVGLPSDTLNSDNRNVLLVENSIKNVFTSQIYELWPWIDSTSVQAYLYNTEAPGFFANYGFIGGGTSPGQQYDALLELIPGLKPYNPAEIHVLEIEFK